MTSFKSYKKCPNCGNPLLTPSIERGDDSVPFSIYQSVAAMPVGVSAQEMTAEIQAKNRFVKTMDFAGAGIDDAPSHFELDLSAPNNSSADFELNLSEADVLAVETLPLAATMAIAAGIADVVEDGEIEVEGLGFEPSEIVASTDLDAAVQDMEPQIELTVDESEADSSLSEEINFQFEQEENTGSSLALELDEHEEEPSLSLDLSSPSMEDSKFTLEVDDPEIETSSFLDLGSPDKADSEFTLEVDDPEIETLSFLDLSSPDKEDSEFTLETEDTEIETSSFLNLGSPVELDTEEKEPLIELDSLELKYNLSSFPDDAETDPRSRISSLDLNYELPSLSEDIELDPRAQIESLDLSYEPPSLTEESPVDPRSQIESLDFSLELEETLPQETIEIPETIVDGIKLELEADDHKDSPQPDKEK